MHWCDNGRHRGGYRKNKATFHAVPPARVRPPPTTCARWCHAWGRPTRPTLPPGAGLARACLEAPTPAAGQPCREPAGHRPAPQGTARTAAGPPARLAARGGLQARERPLPALAPTHPVAPAPPTGGRPAHQRAVAAAWRRQRWPPDGGGWPCAAWVMGRQRRWGGGGETSGGGEAISSMPWFGDDVPGRVGQVVLLLRCASYGRTWCS